MSRFRRGKLIRDLFVLSFVFSALINLSSCSSIAKEDDKACYEIRNRLNLLHSWYNGSKWNWSSEMLDAANPQNVAKELEKISLYEVSSDLRDAVWADAQLVRAGRSAIAMQSPKVCKAKFEDKYNLNF